MSTQYKAEEPYNLDCHEDQNRFDAYIKLIESYKTYHFKETLNVINKLHLELFIPPDRTKSTCSKSHPEDITQS